MCPCLSGNHNLNITSLSFAHVSTNHVSPTTILLQTIIPLQSYLLIQTLITYTFTKIHSTIAFSLSFLALTISTAPAYQAPGRVQVQFTNNITGVNSNTFIPLNRSSISLGQAYTNTNLFKDRTLFITSLEFTTDFTNIVYEVLKDRTTKITSITDL